MQRTPRFRSVVFDFDSTLSSLEGVEWIAAQLGPETAAAITREVNAAMSGAVALETLYDARMERLRPSAGNLRALGDAYREQLAPGAIETIERLREAGVVLHIVSGGFREAILPSAAYLGFAPDHVHAVSILTDEAGEYTGYDTHSPLISQTGKVDVVASLHLPRPSLMVGDGATDAAARPAVDAFAAFTGFVTRDNVVAAADHVVSSYDDVEALVLA